MLRLSLRPEKGVNGFSLIEIIIALAVLGIGLVAVMGYLPMALNASKKAENLTKSGLLAGSLITDVRAASYDDITKADGYSSTVFKASTDYPGFEYKIETSPSGAVNLKTVTVTIKWQGMNKTETRQYQTEIAKYNPT